MSEYFAYHKETLFATELPSHLPINMVKLLPFRFQQCFGPFAMLLAKGFPETGFFRHLSNHVFRSPEVEKYITSEGHLLLENFQN